MKTVRAQICFALSLAIVLGIISNGCGKKNEGGANRETRVAVKTGLPAGTDPTTQNYLPSRISFRFPSRRALSKMILAMTSSAFRRSQIRKA